MNIDIIIIKILLNKDIFNKYFNVIDLNYYKNNNKELYKVFAILPTLHEKATEDASLEDLILFFFTQYPLLKPEEKVLYENIFKQVTEAEVDAGMAIDYLEKHRQHVLATNLALKCLDVTRGKGSISEVIELLNNERPIETINEESLFVSDDLDVLADTVSTDSGLRWRLQTLNNMIGPLRKGNFGFIFKRPETGGTTLLASEVSFMAEQVDNPIVWFNNEEVGSKVMLRCYQAVFGITQQELFTNLDYYKEEYNRRIAGRIKIYDEASIKKATVEKICAELNPSVIIFDQIDKIAWYESERYDLKMKAIYQWARELAKTYGPTIGVCQAGGTAEGKKYLTMNDVDSSHTAKQGEADFMLGIGKTNNDGEEFVRYLSACKNKLDPEIPELRHGKMSVIIQPDIARYEDAMKWK